MLLVLDSLSLIDRTSLILFPYNNIADKESKEASDDNKENRISRYSSKLARILIYISQSNFYGVYTTLMYSCYHKITNKKNKNSFIRPFPNTSGLWTMVNAYIPITSRLSHPSLWQSRKD